MPLINVKECTATLNIAWILFITHSEKCESVCTMCIIYLLWLVKSHAIGDTFAPHGDYTHTSRQRGI
jgi:hypothetical protein